jgi:hypothetical protein
MSGKVLGPYGFRASLAVFLVTVAFAGADDSWVPLMDVESTVPFLHTSSDRLAGEKDHLLALAQRILEDTGCFGKRNEMQGLFIRLDVIEIDERSSRVVLVTTVRFQDIVAAHPGQPPEPWTFYADTWRWDDVSVVEVATLSDVAVSKVSEGVTQFADSLSKAKAIGRRSG